jgi:hypothetical protein
MARDAYAYLYLPMIAGIILFALGAEGIVHQIADPTVDTAEPAHGPDVPLLFGGVMCYLTANMLFQLRTLHTVTWTRVGTLVVLAAAIPVAGRLPALAALTLLTAICVGLVWLEVIVLAESRRALHEVVFQERTSHEAHEADWRARWHGRAGTVSRPARPSARVHASADLQPVRLYLTRGCSRAGRPPRPAGHVPRGRGAAAEAVVVDPALGQADRPRPALVETLQTAVVGRRKIELGYANRAGERTRRLVDPLGLVDKDDIWYLLAGTDDGRRTFRVDRMTDVVVTGLPAERPADFDLPSAWAEVVSEVEQRRSLLTATALVEARWVPILRTQFGRHCEVDRPAEDGRLGVRLTAPTARDVARQLAGWGVLVEVTGPEAVRHELARIGAELTAYYDTPPGVGTS